MKATVRSLALVIAAASSAAMAQQDLLDHSHEILNSIGLGELWLPAELEIELTDYGASIVKSKHLRFTYSSRNTFHSFSWMEKLDELRRRSYTPGRGSHFIEPGQAADRIMEFVDAVVSDSERWRPSGVEEDLSDPHVGNQMEYQGGAITAKLEHVVNGLVVHGHQVAVTFDTMDGKVASIYVSTLSDAVYTDRTNLMTAAQAEDKARRHAVQFLRSTFGEQRAAEITSAFLSPEQASVKLAYGPLRQGFDSKFRDYTTQRVVPPVYTVDFGNAMVYIHAKTGECVGGDLDADSAGASAGNSQSSPPTGDAESLDDPAAGTSETATTKESSPRSPVLIVVGIAALVLGSLYFALTRARRT